MQNTNTSRQNLNFIFFGSSPISVTSLNALKEKGYIPSLIVTQPDKKQGRGLILTPSPVKVWAEEHNIEVITPLSIRSEEVVSKLKSTEASFFILVSYGKIIPQNILDLPQFGILNVHPSLLPLLRGPSPIESTILNDLKDNTGVTIMLLDQKMDEGPILSQKKISLNSWPIKKSELYNILSEEGGKLLTETIPLYLEGKITPQKQDSTKATYCEKIEKNHGLLDIGEDSYKNFLKICAFDGWPGTYFFIKKEDREIRIKITEADFQDGKLIIKKVIPEGKKEMLYTDFQKGL